MTNKEAVEELEKVDTLDMPARLCEAHYMSIKALKQESCEDEYIKVPKKALKYRTAGMVAYNVEWLKNHFDIERAVICGVQEFYGDCVNRQAVLDKKELVELPDGQSFYCISPEDVKNIPSVNPQEPKWTLVSDGLPEDEDYVLVCYADGSIRTAYYYIDTESYPPEFRDCCETGWYDYNEDYMYQDVLAWMPLPEPYKVESEE